MARNIFGKRLYNQIVTPLVLVSMLIGLVATVVAWTLLSDLTQTWVDQVTMDATLDVESRLGAEAQDMLRVAGATATDAHLIEALAAEDYAAARAVIERQRASFDFDHMIVLDPQGAVAVSTGLAGVRVGESPFDVEDVGSRAEPRMLLTNPGGRLALTAFHPIRVDGSVLVLAVSEMIDDSLIAAAAGGTDEALAVYDADGVPVARYISADAPSSDTEREALVDAMRGSERVAAGLAAAARGEGTEATLEIGESRYRMAVDRLDVGSESGNAPAFVLALIDQSVSDEALDTTAQLIIVWSLFAVLALIALGRWVAHRVSDPLVELTAGARRITDGDFSTKIHVAGENEISDLAETFNQMTDSLRERSESLTKKVLELATLYEMSRALGSTLEMDVLLESVLDSALRIFGVDLGYVTLQDREKGELELRAWRGGDSPADEEALRSSMSEWVVREGRPLIFNPTRGDEAERVDAVTGALAALCVPLLSSEGAVGSITVGSRDPEFRFTSDDVRLLSTIANHVTIAIGNIELFSNLQEAYLSTVRSLAAAVDAKDPFTRGHSDRVAQYAVLIGQRLGLSHEQRVALEMAAYLHDIGKIGVKEEILLKPGRLTEAEMGQMRHHPLIGANILKPVGFPWPITPIVRHHHERWDGDGYPAGLRGEETPLLARILTVADAFEAMIADRPYRRGRTIEDALEELERCSGMQFDPKITAVFVEAIKEDLAVVGGVEEPVIDEPQPEETHAIFVALCDGMFSSFRRLGGPKLAANVERELNVFFGERDLPFRLLQGRMAITHNGNGRSDTALEDMRLALRRMDETMGRMSGTTLVDHFYADAMAGLSERMRTIATMLEFYTN